MTFPNGNAPSSALSPIPGSNAGLLKSAARAYKAMHFASVNRLGVPLTIIDGSVGRCYRSFARQVLAKQIFGSDAATPGTSNHGWALAVDLPLQAQRAAIDRIGRQFGWAKEWSDASWEWWHLKYRAGVWAPRPDPLRKLGKRQRAAAERLLYHRRERKREGHTGHGKRWRRQNRWVTFWRERVERFHRRADGERKAVLGRVLADRDGQI
jgi:hypothetical protein